MSHKKKWYSIIVNEWPLKIISLVCAIFTYFLYGMISLEERYLTIPLELNMSESMVSSEIYPDVIKLTLRGKSEDIYLFSDDDFVAIADFSSYSEPGHYVVPIEVKPQRAALLVNDVEVDPSPKVVDLLLDWKRKKRVTVSPQWEGFPSNGFDLVEMEIQPNEVEIEGPASLVTPLESINTANFSIEDRNKSFTQLIELEKPHRSINFTEDSVVRINVIISELYTEKNFSPLPIELSQVPEEGRLKVTPQIGEVRLSGKELMMQEIQINDLSLNVQLPPLERGETVVVPVTLEKPEGVEVIEWSPQEVTVTYEEEESEPEADGDVEAVAEETEGDIGDRL